MSSADDDQILHALRGLLNKDGVKLWLQPYTAPDGSKGEEPTTLVEKYSALLSVPAETVSSLLEQLRRHALDKLAAQTRLKQTGEITLRVKLSGRSGPDVAVRTSVSSTGSELKSLIAREAGLEGQVEARQAGVDGQVQARQAGLEGQVKAGLEGQVETRQAGVEEQIKLICQGRILDDSRTLSQQGVKVNSQVLCICLSVTEEQYSCRQSDHQQLERIREAAEILADKRDDRGGTEGEYFLQVADQSGKPLDLPREERRALALAMTLHEKGRAFLKRRNYTLALLLLVEADEKFRECRSAILDAVDNYALLCLDVVWTYLCLRNLDNLPDASQKLLKCQQCLDRSYGSNMQRVASLKGTSGGESALYVRLHLLQAVVAYHQHRLEQAQLLLAQTGREIQALTVDDALITQVVCLGFSAREARIGLRACQGDVQAAVNHIIRNREERAELRKTEKEERKKKKLARSLGKTANGQWVDVDLYSNLQQMGFPAGASSEALKQSNNNITQALQVLQDQPELLSLPDPGDSAEYKPTDEQIAQMLSMGFDRKTALRTLRAARGSVQKALDDLAGNVDSVAGNEAITSGSASGSTSESGSGGSSSTSSSEGKDEEELVKKTTEQVEKEEAAVDLLGEDIRAEEDEYLDITLEDEARYLEEYSKLLAMSE